MSSLPTVWKPVSLENTAKQNRQCSPTVPGMRENQCRATELWYGYKNVSDKFVLRRFCLTVHHSALFRLVNGSKGFSETLLWLFAVFCLARNSIADLNLKTFLPPNTTYVLKPCDMGLIRALKAMRCAIRSLMESTINGCWMQCIWSRKSGSRFQEPQSRNVGGRFQQPIKEEVIHLLPPLVELDSKQLMKWISADVEVVEEINEEQLVEGLVSEIRHNEGNEIHVISQMEAMNRR